MAAARSSDNMPLSKSPIRPVERHKFVPTEASEKVDKCVSKKNTHAIVLTGKTGSGKTFLAEAQADKLWNRAWKGYEYKIYGQFNCTNLNSLYSDLSIFYKNHGMNSAALTTHHDWKVLKTLYEDLDSQFSVHSKVLVFDDAEDIESVLEVINNICGCITESAAEIPGPNEPSSSEGGNQKKPTIWKIFVTSQPSARHPKDFRHIGSENFVKVNGFSFDETLELFNTCDIEDRLVRNLWEKLGGMPLALKLCKDNLRYDESANSAEFVDKYLHQIETETLMINQDIPDRGGRPKTAIIALKVSIDRLLDNQPYAADFKELLRLLTFFNEKNIPRELLVALAETVCGDREVEGQADVLVQKLTHRLIERDVCSSKKENGVFLYSLHELVQKALVLFVERQERERLLINALVAISRVIPKDGRRHQTRLLGFYAEHAEAVNKVVSSMLEISPANLSFITLLQCSILACMAYCLFAQRTGLDKGLRKLDEARDKYCELVLGPQFTGYNAIALGVEAGVNREQERAMRLYKSSKRLPTLTNCEKYKRYIMDMPHYHRLTEKDLDNMMNVSTVKELVNGHLSLRRLQDYKDKGKQIGKDTVISSEKLSHLFVVELLGFIYYLYSKTHRDNTEQGGLDRCISHAEAAMEVYNQIYEEGPRYYLLGSLIAEREMLAMKIKKPQTAVEVIGLIEQYKKLAQVGSDPSKRFAYECGLMRSDLSQDHYHEMMCLESLIICHGQLCKLDRANSQVHFDDGKELLERVIQLAKKQVHSESAISHCYRNYATFLTICDRLKEACFYIVKAMLKLHNYLVNRNNAPGTFPEFDSDSPRFRALYSQLCDTYAKYRDGRRNEDKVLTEGQEECVYLQNAVASLRTTAAVNQPNIPAGESARFEILVTLNDYEIQMQVPQPPA